MTTLLRQYTIYDHPSDFPDGFVVREWHITREGLVTGEAWPAPTLEAARDLVPPGMYCVGRLAGDDAVIVETWT